MKLRNYFKKTALGLIFGMSLTAMPAVANLSITPTIVMIEGRDRYADVHLVNPTGEVNSYDISWRFFKMVESTGFYEASETSTTAWDLTKHIVYTPRRVSIDPQAAQKVRLGLRLGGEPPAPGDYRAHLEFMKIPERIAPPKASDEKKPTARADVGVRVNVGFSIPVIYRVGQSDATAKIGNVTTAIRNNRIEATIPVQKSESRYGIAGTITVSHKGKVIGQVKNANIFPEIRNRTFVVPLNVQNLSGGTLDITFNDFDKKKNIVYDRQSIPVGK